MKFKVEHFQVYDLVTVCFDYAREILHTRCLGEYHVPWVDQSLYSPHRKSSIAYCSIWNKFHIKDINWNKFNIKIVNMSCDLHCLIFCQFIGN